MSPDHANAFAAALCLAIRSSRSTPSGRPSMTRQRPATMTRSAACAPQRTSAAIGSCAPGKARLVDPVEREVGLHPGADAADVVPAEAARAALGRPAKRVVGADGGVAVAQALKHQGMARGLHDVGGIVRGRAVDAEAYG